MVAVMFCAGSSDKELILLLSWLYSLFESSVLCVVIWTVGVTWTNTLFAGGEWWIEAVQIFATVGATLKWLLLPKALDEGWTYLLGGDKDVAGRTKERSGDVVQLLNGKRYDDVLELLLFKNGSVAGCAQELSV